MKKIQGGERYMSRKNSQNNSRKKSRNKSRINSLRPLAGPQPNGSWVVSSGQIITPAGVQVNLGNQVRAKAIALNPNVRTHTGAVLTLGAAEAVEVFDTNTGVVLQNYITFGTDPSGSYSGIAYSADGTH